MPIAVDNDNGKFGLQVLTLAIFDISKRFFSSKARHSVIVLSSQSLLFFVCSRNERHSEVRTGTRRSSPPLCSALSSNGSALSAKTPDLLEPGKSSTRKPYFGS